MLQCVAVCCRVKGTWLLVPAKVFIQVCVVAVCSVQCVVAMYCNVVQCVAVCCQSLDSCVFLQFVSFFFIVLCCNVLQC